MISPHTRTGESSTLARREENGAMDLSHSVLLQLLFAVSVFSVNL
jgi:hypothetical protein